MVDANRPSWFLLVIGLHACILLGRCDVGSVTARTTVAIHQHRQPLVLRGICVEYIPIVCIVGDSASSLQLLDWSISEM